MQGKLSKKSDIQMKKIGVFSRVFLEKLQFMGLHAALHLSRLMQAEA